MSKIETANWIFAANCFIPAAFLIIMNWVIFAHNWNSRRLNRDSFPSWVPLLGGLLGVLTIWLMPVPQIKTFWWVPLVVDYGCIIGLTETAIYWSKYNKEKDKQG